MFAISDWFREMLVNSLVLQYLQKTSKHLFSQGMEVDHPECGESDPEDEGQPDNEEAEESGTEDEQQDKIIVDEKDWQSCSEDEDEEEKGMAGSSSASSFHNSSRLLHKDELLDMFKAVHNGPRCKEGQLTVGLVGKMLTPYYLPLMII